MNVAAIANLLFPNHPYLDMLRDYASSQNVPTRSHDGCHEVFIAGQWVALPESYRDLRSLIGKPQI